MVEPARTRQSEHRGAHIERPDHLEREQFSISDLTEEFGCTARALSDDLTVDRAELDDARWFSREDVERAVSGDADAPFQPPPPHAIARTLLERWLAA